MRFSILMATNNSAKTLPAALASITEQRCTDYELVVIDNQSTDGTLDLVRAQVPGAVVISEPDAGIYDALNKGLLRATGDWIYVLGSDDRLADASVLERVAQALTPAAVLVYGNVLSTSVASSKPIRMQPPEVYRQRGLVCPPIFHQAAFIRRSALAQIGSFPLSFKIHADHFLLTRAYLAAPPVYIDKTICIYHSGGYSGLSLKSYPRSTREQLVINAFFGAPLWRLIRPFARNLARALINSVRH